jgi:hypothetical protein
MRKLSVWLAAVGLALAVDAAAQGTSATAANPSPNPNPPGSGHDAFVPEATQRTFTVTGTVVRDRKGQMVVRIDDHQHQIPFQVEPGAGPDVAPGSRVSVTYHPTGATGQAIERLQVLEPPRNAHGHRAAPGNPARR